MGVEDFDNMKFVQKISKIQLIIINGTSFFNDSFFIFFCIIHLVKLKVKEVCFIFIVNSLKKIFLQLYFKI